MTSDDSKPNKLDDTPEHTTGDVADAAPVPDPSDRDFGDSAGYGTGGSTRDYHDVVGEDSTTDDRSNPLDAVIPPEPQEQDSSKDSV
jgi:hypothetical protein